MKKKMKWYLPVTGMILLAAVQFGGCQKITALGLMKDAGSFMAKAKSYKAATNVELSMKVEQNRVSMGMDADMEVTSDPMAVHMDGKVDLGIMNISFDMESYSLQEENKIITYTKAGDEWSKEEVPFEEAGGQQIDTEALGKLLTGIRENKIVLEEETQMVGDQEAYVLTAELEGEELESALGMLGKSLGEQGEQKMDLGGLKAEMDFKIYKGSREPAELVISIPEGLDDLINGAMGVGQIGVETKIDRCVYTMRFLSFNTVDQITVPEEALKAAEEGGTGSSQNGLGIGDAKSSL